MSDRILFVDHAGVLGGGELSLLTIAKAFRSGSSVVLFEDGPFRERLESAEVAVEILPVSESVRNVSRDGGILSDLRAVPGLIRQCISLARRARSYDVVYTNSQKSMVIGALAGFFARRPVVWHLRDLLDESHFSRGHIRIAIGVANTFVSLVIANSDATRETFVTAGGKPALSVTIYNGIEPDRFEGITPESRADLRKEFSIPPESTLIGSFSRLADWKGQHIILEAIRSEPDVHVLLVGDALFAADHSYKSMLTALTHRYGMIDRVHFAGFRSDVPDLMSACDIIAHSSTAPEPFGRVIVEGMLAGKPVVATNAGGAAELIESGVTGILVPPNDASAMRGAFVELKQIRAKRDQLAEGGKKAALDRFSSKRMIDEIRGAIRNLVD